MENTDRADLFLCKVKKRQVTASGNYRSKGGGRFRSYIGIHTTINYNNCSF